MPSIPCKDEYGTVQYEDDFVLLTEDFLIIKRYFFPLMKPKIVRLKYLRIAYFDSQENSKYGILRTWGKSDNDIYWAVDFRRCLPGEKNDKSNVVIDIEDGLKKGFSVKDAQTFFAALRFYSPISLIIVDNLNI